MPYYPDDSEQGHYEINTIEEKIISKYTGYNFDRINELDVIEYWLYLRDAAIYNLSQTNEGKEYLEKCWIIEQTAPDRTNLRKQFGKEE